LFEFVLALVFNWCGEWLNFVPNPPVTVLARIDRIAEESSRDSFAVAEAEKANERLAKMAAKCLDGVHGAHAAVLELKGKRPNLMRGQDEVGNARGRRRRDSDAVRSNT